MSFLEKKRQALLSQIKHIRGQKISVNLDANAGQSTKSVKFQKAYDEPLQIKKIYGNKATEKCDYPIYALTLPAFHLVYFDGFYYDQTTPQGIFYLDVAGEDYLYLLHDDGLSFCISEYVAGQYGGNVRFYLNTASLAVFAYNDLATERKKVKVERVKKTEASVAGMTKVTPTNKKETLVVGTCFALLVDKFAIFEMPEESKAGDILSFDSLSATFVKKGEQEVYAYSTADKPPSEGVDLSFLSPVVSLRFLQKLHCLMGKLQLKKGDEIEEIGTLPPLRHLSGQITDYLYSEGTQLFLKRYVGELVLSGEENDWALSEGVFSFPLNGALDAGLCSHFTLGNPATTDLCYRIKDGVLELRYDEKTTVSHLKEWLKKSKDKGHPFTLWYALEMPEVIPLRETPAPPVGDSELLFSAPYPLGISLYYQSYKNQANAYAFLQQTVRGGLASRFFSVGDQITCQGKDEKGNPQTLVWDVVGFDIDTPADAGYSHSMTLQLHTCWGKLPFDENGGFSWANSSLRQFLSQETFLSSIDPKFLKVLGKVKKQNHKLNEEKTAIMEDGITEDLFFIPSFHELFGSPSNAFASQITSPPLYPFYQKAENLDYLKEIFGYEGFAPWWTRTPCVKNADRLKMMINVYYMVSGNKVYNSSSPPDKRGVAPMCCIV